MGQSRVSETDVANVLIIDDDPAISRMLRLSLLGHGFTVRIAVHGQDGLERLDESEPDVIVLDLQMPVMDGRAFYRELRSRGFRTPVMILSAFGADKARAELGAESYLNKPFEPDELVDRVRSLVQKAS